MTPCVRLRRETLLVDCAAGMADDFRPVETGVIELSFEYDGREFPDGSAEQSARRTLEALGPVELECLDDCAAPPGAKVDYVVDVVGDPSALCTFSSHAIPRLKSLGWSVVVEPDYPCHVVTEGSWYAEIHDDDDRDWFELELGIDVEGQRVDLLPILLELLKDRRRLGAMIREPAKRIAVPLGGQRFLALPPERLHTIVRVLAELYEMDGAPKGTRIRMPRHLPHYFGELEEAFSEEPMRWSGAPQLRQKARSLVNPRAEDVCVPAGLQATLRPYQHVGLAWLQALRSQGLGGVLADDMGLGKTLQTIAHLVAEREAARLSPPALVVAPTSLVQNWRRELERFAPYLRAVVYHGRERSRVRRFLDDADVIVTTYPLLLRDRDLFEKREASVLVLDEAQVLKNSRSQIHRVVSGLAAGQCLALTGTPIENGLDELWSLMSIVVPGLLGDQAGFRANFRQPIETRGDNERMDVLRGRIAPFVLRRTKDRVAKDLPPKTEIVRPVELQDRQRDLYESIRLSAHSTVQKAVRKKGLSAATIDILGALMKLRQACCDPRLVAIDAARDVGASAKFDALFELLASLLEQNRRVLIFSQFTSMLALIADELRRRRIQHVVLTGGTTDRQGAVDAFQGGLAPVFLISLKAGGTGLNLTAADTVIHYDPWWNPAAQAQATDRAYRIGQRSPVFVYNLIVAGSVEERILELQRRKQALADRLLAAEDAQGLLLTASDVAELFAPLASEEDRQ